METADNNPKADISYILMINLQLNLMTHYIDEDSLIVDSGRTGCYNRIITEDSIEGSPKNDNIKLFTIVDN